MFTIPFKHVTEYQQIFIQSYILTVDSKIIDTSKKIGKNYLSWLSSGEQHKSPFVMRANPDDVSAICGWGTMTVLGCTLWVG